MTSDSYAIISTTITQIWRLFTSWTVPGTNVTPGEWFMFLVVAGVAIRTFKRIMSRDISENSGGKKSGS